MGNLRERLDLVEMPTNWLCQMSVQYHYMHRRVHARATPFGWGVTWDGQLYHKDGAPYGFIVFASVHFTRLRGEFGYPGLPTKWQVLCLSRLWLHDALEVNSETCVIAKALKRVQRRWLEVHPPVRLDEPYHILKIISYADTRFHTGTIYKAANFRYTGDVISRSRHRNTRDSGMDGARLMRFIYDLKEPRWTVDVNYQLPLFDAVAR